MADVNQIFWASARVFEEPPGVTIPSVIWLKSIVGNLIFLDMALLEAINSAQTLLASRIKQSLCCMLILAWIGFITLQIICKQCTQHNTQVWWCSLEPKQISKPDHFLTISCCGVVRSSGAVGYFGLISRVQNCTPFLGPWEILGHTYELVSPNRFVVGAMFSEGFAVLSSWCSRSWISYRCPLWFNTV